MFHKRKSVVTSGSLSQLAWHCFTKNIQGMIALAVIVLAVLLGLFACVLIPDQSPNANR